MKRTYITTFLTCIAVLCLFFGISRTRNISGAMSEITVGFIYESDESAPYSYNFSRAAVLLKEELRDSVNIETRSNVPDDAIEDTLQELSLKGCSIIFTNCHSENISTLAAEYPGIQICQISDMVVPPTEYPDNYHTFNSEIYQARYVSGIAAGLKLQELIDQGVITKEEAVVGYVGAYPASSVISGYTAFLVGVRSIVPEAVMKVSYTHTWSSYMKEKSCAQELIEDGCVVLSHHSDTIGVAVACEEAAAERPVIFIGCNKSYQDIAPTATLLSIRTNWVPYMIDAVTAVMNHQTIESRVKAKVHGKNDMSAGFAENALDILDLNRAADKMLRVIDDSIKTLLDHPEIAYQGPYTGMNPEEPSDWITLEKGYIENLDSSAPSFHYVLEDVIQIVHK